MKKIIIIACIVVLIIIGVAFGINYSKKDLSYYDGLDINPDIEDKDSYDERSIKEEEYYEIGRELYSKATEIYSINPYCGKKYEDIAKKDIINENNTKYYRTNYASVMQINNEVNEYFIVNLFGVVSDYITKDGVVYCKYTKKVNSSDYLKEFSLEIVNDTDNVIEYTVYTRHLAPIHSDVCSVDNPIDCSSDEEIEKSNRFVIEKVNNKWKIKEFYNPYSISIDNGF